LPGPAVELAISAPPAILKLPAATLTFPPGPDCGPVAEAAIAVAASPAPASNSAPLAVTSTRPPAPLPSVVLTISAPSRSVICAAVTLTAPALPLAVDTAEALIPLDVPSGALPDKAASPATATRILPPLPGPAVELAISAPPEIV